MSRRAMGRSLVAILGALVLVASTAVEAQPKAGSVAQEKPARPLGAADVDSVELEREVERGGGEEESIELGSSRIAYAVRGGLLAVDNLLLIDDDGSVFYRATSLAVPSENFEIRDRLSMNHVRALKLLVRDSGFASMPARFVPEGIVIDGVELGIAARLQDGSEKTVWSETAALESAEFTRLRILFDDLVAELRAREVMKLTSLPGDGGVEVREFRLMADGRFRIEIRAEGLPLGWAEGRLSAADRDGIQASLAKFDFAGSRLCRASADAGGEVHELFVATAEGIRAVSFSADGSDASLEPLVAILGTAKRVARGVGL